MKENEMHKVFEPLNPTSRQREQMWTEIEKQARRVNEGEQELSWRHKSRKTVLIPVVVMLVVLLVIGGAGAAVNAATGGNLAKQLKQWFAPASDPETEQDIVSESVELADAGLEVYAPDILSLDEQYLLFGNLRGILVYDLRKDKLLGTIDTQKIDCSYFGTDSTYTRVWKEDDAIYVWNEKGEKPKGSVYCFRIRQDGDQERVVSAGTVDTGARISRRYHRQDRNRRIDTFRQLSGWAQHEEALGFLVSGSHTLYSENSYQTRTEEGEKQLHFLTLHNDTYCLYSCSMDTKEVTAHKLCLTVAQRKNRSLPEFEYTGDDPALAAIIAYQKQEWRRGDNLGQYIPEYVIYKKAHRGKEYLVFGNFHAEGFRLVGNILQSLSGGEMPACFHLKKQGDGYRVVKVERVMDGGLMEQSIRKMTKGYPGLYEKFMDRDNEIRRWKKARKKYLRMYVREHDLEIKGYKDFGWDTVEIDQ